MKALRCLAALGLSFLFLLPARPAAAHPLGNFTVNAFSDIQVSVDSVTVDYVLDFAEIPTFQIKEALGLADSGAGRTDEVEEFFRSGLVEGLELTADGQEVELTTGDASVEFVPGQGGLETMRLDVRFEGVLPEPEAVLDYEDTNYSDRVGWREIIIRAVGEQGLVSSTVPEESISDALRSYPKDLLSSPPEISSASAEIRPGAASGNGVTDVDVGDTSDTPSIFGGSFASLIERDPSFGVIAGALLLALGFGAVHALGPGHGKTVMAAYLVGAEGKARQAVIVGIAVSLMHTTSVVVLGLITLAASSVFAPESVYPWLSLVSGLVVLGLGTWLLRTRLNARKARAVAAAHEHHSHEHHSHGSHSHVHEEHNHGHEHAASGGAAEHARAHALGQDHSHGELPPGVPLLSWRGLGAIAVSGGLLPSPSALVVLLGAVALNRVGFGIALVAAFSVGLAGALTIVGLLVLKARDIAARRPGGKVGQLLPILSAGAILLVGAVLTTQAVMNLPF
jgi:ABC-type nickel/cobalt efflux system permease component RcnA